MSYQSYNKGSKAGDLWRFKEAKNVSAFERFMLLVLVITGIISILRFADWWFRRSHIGNPVLFMLLSLAFWYSISRLILIWINYLRIKKAPKTTAPPDLKVAIFTTSSPGEPVEMFEKTLAACARITYPQPPTCSMIHRNPSSGSAPKETALCGWNWSACPVPKPARSIKHWN